MSEAIVFQGARVILPDGEARVSVRIEGGKITSLDGATDGARVIDCRGLILAPALVDIHGDAFERQVMPRPGVFVPVDVALLETDRQLAGSGIATAYHALTLSWEPGLRSVDRGAEFIDALGRLATRLSAENRVQLRWETYCFEAMPLIERVLATAPTPSLAFNDHTTMAVLDPSVPIQERPFDLDPAFPMTDTASSNFVVAMSERAKRSGLSKEDYVTLLMDRIALRPDVAPAISRVAALGQGASAPMLSHDDSQVESRNFYRGHGARITEFPMRRAVAEAAREAGDWIVFGAPNAARGGSHLGSTCAGEMVEAGLCDILASDYFYPAMLAAVARLHADKRGDISDLWKLVSQNPAEASRLNDRGRIEPGKRADLVLIDWPEGHVPANVLTLREGRTAFAACDLK